MTVAILFSLSLSRAQEISGPQPLPLRFSALRSLRGDFMMMEVDALDNLYVITRDYQLKKYNSSGDSLSVWNDVKAYGNPTLIDVSNPLRILLYYKPFSTVVILDRFLAFRHAINLRKEGIFRVTAVANSYDNNIWLFDEQDLRLKKINDEGKLLFETADFRMLFESAPSPFRIMDHENSIYIFDEKSGWYVFDYYGSLKKRMPDIEWKITGRNKDFIYGFSEQTMFTAELPLLSLKKYQLPEGITANNPIRIMNGRAYLLQTDGVRIFSIENKN